MTALCVIGIDALDPDLLQVWRHDLPTFDRLMTEGRWARLQSTFPPDSIPAWTTIYTGLDPSEHGGLEYVNYLDVKQGLRQLDNSRLRGRTFWDRASAAGLKVLVLNPFMAYPAWPVNGAMISGPVFVDGTISVEPNDLQLPDQIPELGGMVDLPTRRTRESFYERCARVTEEQGVFFRTMLANQEWDLAYVLFLTLDRVKHFYWRFEDRDDPCFERWESRSHPIRDFYRLLDRILGGILAELPSGVSYLVLSDHGHKRRCTRLFYVNELLRRADLLSAPTGLLSLLAPNVLLERAKNLALDLAFAIRGEDLLTAVAQFVPNRKALKRGDHVIGLSGTVARTSSFAGVNPFGGIVINDHEAARRSLDREAVLNRVIALMQNAIDPSTARPVVRWIKRREEAVPKGARQAAYPDLLFELEPDYGVSWAIYRPLFGPNVTHRKISGGHTREGVIILGGSGRETELSRPAVGDVHSLVLDLLGV